MKKIKIGIWLIIILFLGLVVYQNRIFFLGKESLGIDLVFTKYQSPELPVVLFFAGLFCLGWLMAYLSGLAERFRTGKQIKTLKQTNDTQQHAIDDMKRDVEALKPNKASETQPPLAVEEEQVTEPVAESDPEFDTEDGPDIETESGSDPKPGLPADQN